MWENVHLSVIAIVVAAFAKYVIGMIWYHPKVFGTPWAESLHLRMEGMKPEAKDLISAGVIALVSAFVLALFIDWTAALTSLEGAQVGFWAALGFIATTKYSHVIWTKSPLRVFFIDVGYCFVAYIIMGALISTLTY